MGANAPSSLVETGLPHVNAHRYPMVRAVQHESLDGQTLCDVGYAWHQERTNGNRQMQSNHHSMMIIMTIAQVNISANLCGTLKPAQWNPHEVDHFVAPSAGVGGWEGVARSTEQPNLIQHRCGRISRARSPIAGLSKQEGSALRSPKSRRGAILPYFDSAVAADDHHSCRTSRL